MKTNEEQITHHRNNSNVFLIKETTRFIKVPNELYIKYIANSTTVYKGSDKVSNNNTKYIIQEVREGTLTLKNKITGKIVFTKDAYVKRGTLASWMRKKNLLEIEDKSKKDYYIYLNKYKDRDINNNKTNNTLDKNKDKEDNKDKEATKSNSSNLKTVTITLYAPTYDYYLYPVRSALFILIKWLANTYSKINNINK